MLWDWPSWLDDYLAAALLLYAWFAGSHDAKRSRPYLMAAWGYTMGMAYVSFFGQLHSTSLVDPSGAPRFAVLGFKLFGLLLAVSCLALCWRESD